MLIPSRYLWVIVVVLLSFSIVPPLSADIYFWKDEKGITRFSNHTSPNNAKIFIKTKPYVESNPEASKEPNRSNATKDWNPPVIEEKHEDLEALTSPYRKSSVEIERSRDQSDQRYAYDDVDDISVKSQAVYQEPYLVYAGHYNSGIRISGKYYYPKRHYKKHIYRKHYQRHLVKPHYYKKKFYPHRHHIKKHPYKRYHFRKHYDKHYRYYKHKDLQRNRLHINKHRIKKPHFKGYSTPRRLHKATPQIVKLHPTSWNYD